MNFQDYLNLTGALLAAIGGGGVLIFSLSSWLGKVWASRILEKERVELARLSNEHHVRFAALHDKQSIIIAELYEKLYEVDYAVRQIDYAISQKLLEPRKEWIADPSLRLTDHLLHLRKHFEKHQIYFSESLCERMRELIESSSEISDEYFVSLINVEDDKLAEACIAAQGAVNAKKKIVDDGLIAIRDEFRKLLGVS